MFRKGPVLEISEDSQKIVFDKVLLSIQAVQYTTNNFTENWLHHNCFFF